MAQWRLRSEHFLPQEAVISLEGRLCLGFVNTWHPRYGRHVHDALAGYPDLLAWHRSVGMLTEAHEKYLLQAASAHPEEALRVFERAITHREATYRVFSAVAAERAPTSEDLDVLQGSFVEAMAHASLLPTAREFSWEWRAGEESGHEEELTLLLWPLALSALELLTSSSGWGRIKECPGCGWLFLDFSKTGNRRWCSMDECGSRAKMRRQYARKRAPHNGALAAINGFESSR
ncbi:MAG TPA: ABATE domain-containing protein [Ktedonobacterales bacterium]|jgi:predicted RNA-binding Zn ribbon-like protein|nr:ABATE domain-containing protein [Ktedonobacterales bacterium]